MPKKIIIATGGTGGHIYPAMALAEQLTDELPDAEILFLGGGLATNRYFDRSAFQYESVACGSFVKKDPWSLFRSSLYIGQGLLQSCRVIRAFAPDAAVGFGSFYSFPPMLAAKLMSVPLILHEANSIPGKVNKLLSKYAAFTGVHFPKTLQLVKGNVVEVGMPLRSAYRHSKLSRHDARRYYGFEEELPVLLVFGGSQGARAINTLMANLAAEGPLSGFQVLHVAGDAASAELLRDAYAGKKIRAIVKPFEEHMDIAWQAADVVICRAGASTIAEQLEFEVPGILIPYPQAADNHQEHNADFIANTVGGGVKLREKDVDAEMLASHLISLLQNGGASLNPMRMAMKAYKKQSRKRDLCSLVKEVIFR